MNTNIFKKIGVFITGIAVAVGVGVAIGSGNAYQEARADTKSYSWDLTTSSSDWSSDGCVTYFSQPYGIKSNDAYIMNDDISDFSTNGITAIKLGVKALQNGGTTSRLTLYLVDSNGDVIGSGQEVTPTNANNASNTAYEYVTFNSGFSGATGFKIQCTTFGKNILINGASYQITYTSDTLTAITSISGTPRANVGGSWTFEDVEVRGTLTNGGANSDVTSYVNLTSSTEVPEEAGDNVTVSVTATSKTDNTVTLTNNSLTGVVTEVKGIESNPYWADEARTAALGGDTTDETYVKGWVIIAEVNTSYSNVYDIYISSDKNKSSSDRTALFACLEMSAGNESNLDLSKVSAGDFIIARGHLDKDGSQARFMDDEYYSRLVEHNRITSIDVNSSVSVVTPQYVGNDFNATGITITGHYYKGPDFSIPTNAIDWNDLVAGENPTGTYSGGTDGEDYVDFDVEIDFVTVLENTLSITITGSSLTNNNFKSNESWNHAGLTASGTYADGVKPYTGTIKWSYSPATPSLLGAGDNQDLTVYAYNDKNGNDTMDVGEERDSVVVKVNVEAVEVDVEGITIEGLTPDGSGEYNVELYYKNITGYQLNASVYPETVLDKGLVYDCVADNDAVSISNSGFITLHNATLDTEAMITITSHKDENVFVIVNVTMTNATGETIAIHQPLVASNFTKITSAGQLTDGEYLIVYETGNVAFNGNLSTLDVSSNTIAVTRNNTTISATEAALAATFTYNSSENTLRSHSGYYIGKTGSGNGMDVNAETKYTNTITFSSNNVVITGSGNSTLKYNSSDSRFRYYGSGQSAIQLYKLNKTGGDSVLSIRSELYEAVVAAESEIACESSGEGSLYDWEAVENAFNTFKTNYSDEFNKLAYAVVDEDGNALEQFLARYDYIVKKYGEDDFLSRKGKATFSQISSVYENNSIAEVDNVVIIISIIAVSSFAVFGGYFFLRKRKEDK